MSKKNPTTYCTKCGEPRGLEIKLNKIKADCDICGKNKNCTKITKPKKKVEVVKAIPKNVATVKKSGTNTVTFQKQTATKTVVKDTKKTKKVVKKLVRTEGKASIPTEVLEVLEASKKGMTADHIIEKLPKKRNKGSILSAITRLKKSGKIKVLKTKIKSTDGRMETAYKA